MLPPSTTPLHGAGLLSHVHGGVPQPVQHEGVALTELSLLAPSAVALEKEAFLG